MLSFVICREMKVLVDGRGVLADSARLKAVAGKLEGRPRRGKLPDRIGREEKRGLPKNMRKYSILSCD